MIAFYQHDLKIGQCRIRHSLEFKLHFHHHIELVYMLKGKGTAIVEGTEYKLRPGDILTVFPNQLHEYKDAENEEFFITIFKPELLPEYRDIFYNMVPEKNLFSDDGKNSFLFNTVSNLLEAYKSDKLFKEQIFKGLLTAFFGELFSNITLTKAKTADLSVLKSVLLYCNENYLNDISLSDVAEHLHISKYYVSHLLNDKLNIGFNTYINSLRVSEAVLHLEDGSTDMTEIAQKCGFNTVRTFNRAFKSIYGIPPCKYKNITAVPE